MVNRKSKIQNPKSKIRKGDTVKVLCGKDRGKSAQVMAVLPRENKVLVEGVNMVMKHIRPRRGGEKGQRVAVAAPLDWSNVQLVCPACRKTTRVKINLEHDSKQRICRKCGEAITVKG